MDALKTERLKDGRHDTSTRNNRKVDIKDRGDSHMVAAKLLNTPLSQRKRSIGMAALRISKTAGKVAISCGIRV